jgi:anti-anti-sigma factor
LTDRHPAAHASALHSITLTEDINTQRHDSVDELEVAYLNAEAVDIVIDLDQVPDLDQTGLERLAFLYRDATERGGTVTLTRAPARVVKAIQTSGLDRLLVLADVPRHG